MPHSVGGIVTSIGLTVVVVTVGGGGGGGAPTRSEDIGWLNPGETRTVSWQVEGTGTAMVTIGSTRGGVATREVRIGG